MVTPCFSCLLSLLRGKRLWAMLLGVHCDLVGGPEDRNRAPVQVPEGSCKFLSLLYSVFFSCLLFRSCWSNPQLSHGTGCSSRSFYLCILEFAQRPPGSWPSCAPSPESVDPSSVLLLPPTSRAWLGWFVHTTSRNPGNLPRFPQLLSLLLESHCSLSVIIQRIFSYVSFFL